MTIALIYHHHPVQGVRWRLTPSLVMGVLLLLLGGRPAGATGLLGSPGTFGVDGAPVGVVAADVDLQNGVDLITANEAGEDGPSLSFLLNRGDGSFDPEQRLNLDGTQYILHAIAAGDFNGDGAGDIAVAVDDITVFPVRAAVLVYLNDGFGQFLNPDTYPLLGLFPQCLQAGDVTGDGVADLVVCHSVVGSGTGVLSVLAGAASGKFNLMPAISVGTNPTSVAVAKLDADSQPDLVVGDSDEGKVFVLYGDGTGHLQPPAVLGAIDSPVGVAVDQTGTGQLPDVLVVSQADSQLQVFHQTSSRSFTASAPLALGQVPSSLSVGDLNGDGVGDAVVLSQASAQLSLWLGDGNGGFVFNQTVKVDNDSDSLVVGDLNGDGKPEAAMTSFATDRVTVVLNGEDVPPTPGGTTGTTPTETPIASPSPGVTTTPGASPTSLLSPVPTPTKTPTTTPPTASATPTATPSPTSTPTATPTPAGPGDANCDGLIDARDLDALISRLFVPGCEGADIDGDNQVTVGDLLLLMQTLAGRR